MDLDGDGRLDLVSGSYHGTGDADAIYLFRGSAGGDFAPPEPVLGVDRTPVSAGKAPNFHPATISFRRSKATAPWFADLRGTGALDLLIGSMEGEIVLVRNEGTRMAPRYAAAPELLMQPGRPILVPGGDAGPVAADWDGDGLVDLLCGSASGAVFFFRNVGSTTRPEFQEGVCLIPGGSGFSILWPGETPRPGRDSRVCPTDWNRDGKPDLLVGDCQRIRYVKAGLDDLQQGSVRKALARFRELQSRENGLVHAREERMWRLGYRPPDAFSSGWKDLQTVWKEQKEVLDSIDASLEPEQPHGFVWLYLRK